MYDPLQNGGHHVKRNDSCSSPYEGKKLFTPGPLTTSATVKRAMLRDVGSRTEEMMSNIAWIREKLVEIAGLPCDKFTCVPMQGSGSFSVEAVFNTTSKKDGSARILIIVNGRYGERMVRMCECMGLTVHALNIQESKAVNAEIVQAFLERDSDWTSIGIVHSETSSGLFNDVEEVGRIIKEHCPGALYIVDAMSSFGGVPLDVEAGNVDFLVSSANKCIEGVPGFGYTICRKDALIQCEGRSSSVCLDIVDQYLVLEEAGNFRFTPPTHSILAFRQAVEEFLEEGGVNGRAKRYKELHRILCEGMKQLGFERYISSESHGYIITSFIYPRHPNWSFKTFNDGLLRLGQVIYPGSTTKDVPTFRVGSIGQLCPGDMSHLIECMKKVLSDMNMPVPVY